MSIAYSSLYLVTAGVIKLSNIIPTLAMQACISALFLFSYFFASTRKIDEETGPSPV
jgi:hypothetical protein